MVIKNEAANYLDSVLEGIEGWADDIHVYDDQSDDESLSIVRMYTQLYATRRSSDDSFLQHEGRFRQAAWRSMCELAKPQKDDWVFCIDADEFLVGSLDEPHPRKALEMLIEYADKTKRNSVSIQVDEVWDLSEDLPQARVDGWWAKNRPPRLVRWKPNGEFKDAKLGCGSVPIYGQQGPAENISVCRLLHFGYTLDGALEHKHGLYSNVDSNKHSKKHIDSILTKPKLASIHPRLVPDYWQGIK